MTLTFNPGPAVHENIEVKGELVQKIEYKQTDTTGRITFPANAASNNLRRHREQKCADTIGTVWFPGLAIFNV